MWKLTITIIVPFLVLTTTLCSNMPDHTAEMQQQVSAERAASQAQQCVRASIYIKRLKSCCMEGSTGH
jgi:hypothetical protein